MSADKVCLYSCGGIGLVSSCVTRLAGYVVAEELLPDRVELLSVPGLLRGLPQDVAMLEQYPTIVIDGCADHCGSNLMRLAGIMPAARIYTPDVTRETHLKPGHSRQELEDCGKALAEEVARRATTVALGLLDDSRYAYQPQHLMREGQVLCDREVDVEEALGYVKVAEGLYRPQAMPKLPGFEE